MRLDGRPLARARELHKDDVLSVGDAQIVIADDSRTRLRLDVQHLVGNATIAPVVTVAAVDFEAGDEDLEIRAASGTAARVLQPRCSPPRAAVAQRMRSQADLEEVGRDRRGRGRRCCLRSPR